MKRILEFICRARVFWPAFLLCVGIHTIPVAAQETTAPEITVIHAGRLFDAHAGRMLEN